MFNFDNDFGGGVFSEQQTSGKYVQAARDIAAINVRNTAYFYSHHAAMTLIREIRWPTKIICPRCSASALPRNAFTLSETYRCVRCGYSFSSTSNTRWHGSKLGAHTELCLMVLLDISGPEFDLRAVSRIANVSLKTVKARWLERSQTGKKFNYLAVRSDLSSANRANSPTEFLETIDCWIHEGLFRARLSQLIGAA